MFQGLYFSPYNTVVEILWNDFFDEIPLGIPQSKAKELMPECTAVFNRYDLNDDYTGTAEYKLLYTELIGTIAILLEDEL